MESDEFGRCAQHSIYTGIYTPNKWGDIKLGGNCRWLVLKLEEMKGSYGRLLRGPEPIALILEDGDNCFWPVISFLDPKDAVALGQRLIKAGKGADKE